MKNYIYGLVSGLMMLLFMGDIGFEFNSSFSYEVDNAIICAFVILTCIGLRVVLVHAKEAIGKMSVSISKKTEELKKTYVVLEKE